MKKLYEYILYLKYNGSMLNHWSGYLTYDVPDSCWVVNAGKYHVVTEYDMEVYRVDNVIVDGWSRANVLCDEINRTPIDHEWNI